MQEIAIAVFRLRERTKQKLQFPQIMTKTPSYLLKALEGELNNIAGQDKRFAVEMEQEEHPRPEIQELLWLCPKIEELKKWRDPRIHSRVELEPSIALFDWKTRIQLDMTAVECSEKSDLAVNLAMKIRFEVESLHGELNADDAMLRELSIEFDRLQDD